MAFNLTAQLNIALNSASLRNASSQLNAALNSNTQVKLGIDRSSASGLGQIKSQISEATDSMENFGRQAGFAAKRFAAFAVTAGSIIAFTNTMKEAVSAAVDFDREMVRLRQVSSDTVQDVGAVGEQVTNLSKSLGVSSKDLIGVAVVLKQANLTLSETKDDLEAMAQAALAPNFDNLKDTTEGAIAIMKQFKVEAKDLGAALGSVNAVAGEFAVEASDIIEAIRKTGGAFKAAGGQLNELIALFTSVRQTTRESAESIGTGLRTIFTRIQRNDTANALKEVGINLRYTADEARALGDAGLEQQFVGPYEAVKRLSAGLSDLRSTDPRFSAIVEQLGGYRQISKVIPLIQEFATAQKALGIAQAGSVSLAVNAGQAQDALAVKLQKLKESFFEVGRSIVNSPGFRSLADTFIGAATSVLSLINSLKGLLPLFTALAAVKIGQGIGSFATGFVKGAGADSSSVRTTRKADGGFLKMRTGGIVPGSGTGDKVPALLEPGELVVPKNKVTRKAYKDGDFVRVDSLPEGSSYIKKYISDNKDTNLELDDKVRANIIYKSKTDPIHQKKLTKREIERIYSSRPLSEETKKVYETPAGRKAIYASAKDKNLTYKGLNNEQLTKMNAEVGSAQALWGVGYEKELVKRNKSKKLSVASTEHDHPVDLQRPVNVNDPEGEKIYGEAKFKTKKEPYKNLVSKLLRKKLMIGETNKYFKENIQNEFDGADLGDFEYYDTFKSGGHKDQFTQAIAKFALGGPIPRQRFMEGEEVTHRKSFLDNSFNPGMKLKSALQDTPRIIFKRQPKEYEKFPNMDHTSPHFEQFSEMFVGSRKASQFKRAVEYQRLYQEALKNNDVESANKYDKLNKLPANMRLLAAAKALPSAQEKARTNSFEDGNFDYEKNLLVNYSGKKTTTRHELGAHAAAYGASKEGSPLANSLFGSIGRRMGAYGKGSGETTLISEMQAHTIQSAKQKDKINSLKEFISSEKMAKLYKSEAHSTLVDSIKKGYEVPTAGVLGGRHKGIEIDVLKRMMQDAHGDNSEVLAEKMALLNPNDSSNKVNFSALFADSKETKRYAFGGNVGRQMFADGDKATAKPQSFEEFSKSLNPKQLADFKEKIKSAKQIIVNARTSGSMKLKSVGFNFLGTKFNMIPNKDLADKGSAKSKDGKPTYDLKGVKSLDELLSKLPPKHSEGLRAKIGRAQDKFLETKDIKGLKFNYDFGDKRGALNVRIDKDVIKFGTIGSFPWKPKTPKEKRTEELRVATERNARKKADNIAKTAKAEKNRNLASASTADAAKAKTDNASSLSSIISGIDQENQQNKTFGIARDTRVFEGSDQYKELQKKLALDRQRREGRGLPNPKEGIQPENLIGIDESYKAPQQQVDPQKFKFFSDIPGTSPQAQRLRMQREEGDFNENLNIKIARSQKTKKEPRTPKTESERYNISRKQSAPAQEKTLFDEMELAKIGSYGTQEQKIKDNADALKRLRDTSAENRIKGNLRLNERQSNRVRERGIANENLADNLRSLRSTATAKPVVSETKPQAQATIPIATPIAIAKPVVSEPKPQATTPTAKPIVSLPNTQIPEDNYDPYAKVKKPRKPRKPRATKKTSNTASYDTQEAEYQRLLAGIAAASRTKKGRFATGGLVPGTGNSDTVPMDLPEGSFVIRKSSVNKIGADNLAKASRFARGGTVPALVMPGEYIYSPQEASKIGSSKLHAMNQFAKFARGGSVKLGKGGTPLSEDNTFDPTDPRKMARLAKQLVDQQQQNNPDLTRSQARTKAATSYNDIKTKGQKLVDTSAEANRLKAQLERSTKTLEDQQTVTENLSKGIKGLEAAQKKQEAFLRANPGDARAQKKLDSVNNQLADKRRELVSEKSRLVPLKQNVAADQAKYKTAEDEQSKAKVDLDQYKVNKSGEVTLNNKVVGEQSSRGPGSISDIVKQKTADFEATFNRKATKEDKKNLKQEALGEYRTGVEKQVRADAVKRGKPVNDIQVQSVVDNYVNQASKGQRKLMTNAQGEITGDTGLGKKLVGGGYKETGELTKGGKAKDFAERALFGAKRTDFETGAEGDQQFKESRGSTVANRLTTAAVGASFVSERIKASGGTVAGIVSKGEGDTVKVDENAASGFKSAQAFGAALSSASTYAAVAGQSLAKFGPVVAGVGAGIAGIVGAMEGYHNGIKQAEAEIREAKIAQALNNLQNIFERVSNGLLEVNDSTLRKISENQKVVSQENATKAYEESGGNASNFMKGLNIVSFGLAGNDVNQKKYNESLSKSSKETNAAQIGPLTNVLNKYSEQIGKDAALKIKSGGGDISTTNFEDLKGGLLKDLRSAGGGAGGEQIAKIASAQDISIADAEKQFIKTLQESFQAEKIKSVTTKAVQENARAINSMQSLSNAVNAAAASADSFSSKLDTNSSLFEGSIGSTKLTSFAEKSGGSTPDFAKFNTAITESSGALGVYGEQFKSQGNAVNAASQILPDILAQSVANPISGKDTSTQITDALKEGLKARGITGAAADQVVSSVGGKVSSEDFTKLLAEAGGDVSKATQKLMSDISDPLISAFNEIDSKLTDAGNKYISGLEDLAKRQKAIGDQIGRLSDLRGRSRSFAANEIQTLPGVQQGVAESINLQGARNDFSEQQQRLTGFGAGAAENPAAIASRLKSTQQQIRVQEEKVLNTNKSTNGGAEFRSAALELTKLKSQSSNLNDALKNLTDQSKKLEAAQAKLAQVRQNIDEKRSLGRKLLTQGPEEQQKMLQGQAIFNQVQARGGSLQGMSTEQNAILFDFLDNFGAAGKKIQDQILDANGYGAGKDDKAEEKALVAEQARIFAQQEEAQRQIIANQQSLQQDYFSNLDSRNEKFYSELQKFTQEMQKNSLIAEKGKEQQKVAQIKDVQKEGKFLGESGFNTKEDFQKLNTYKQQVTDLAKNKKEQNRLAEANSKPISTRIKTDMNNVITNTSDVEAAIVSQGGYKGSEAAKIREITQEKLSQGNNVSDSLRLAKEQFNQQRGDELNAQQTKIQSDFKASGIEEKLNSLAQKLAGNEISFDQFDRALASIKELQLGVGEGLSTAATNAEARIKVLNEAINGLGGVQQIPNAEAKPQVSAFAVGGSVFAPRGTDTVPAMLTPGEFVVNRNATKNNLGTLNQINSGKTKYLASGGITDDGITASAASSLFEPLEQIKNAMLESIGRNIVKPIASGSSFSSNKTETNSISASGSLETTNNRISQLVNLSSESNNSLSTIAERVSSLLSISSGSVQVSNYKPEENAQGLQFANGGSVFSPRGTDTVPAMLTPGEFVVNRSATQQNLPLLQSINSGKTSYLSGGGKVGYYEDGATPIENKPLNYNQEFIESDEYKNATKTKYLQVSSFSGDLQSKAFKLQKDKTNNDYLKESNVVFGSFRGLTSAINKAISNSNEKENISKIYSKNFTTSANDFIKERKDIKELGIDGLYNHNDFDYDLELKNPTASILDFFNKQAENDESSRNIGINNFQIQKEKLKNKIAAKKSLTNALGRGLSILAGGISNLTPTYSEFNEIFPTTKLGKKQKEVETSSKDYVDFALGIKQKGDPEQMDYIQDVANARKQFDKRKAEERQKIIDEQQKLKNEKEAQFKIDTAGKLDISNVLDKQGTIAKTKDIEKQKAKLKGSGIQGDYVNSGLISEVGAQNVDKFIKEKGAKEDNYFFRRKGSPEAIAKIYLQREAQAQAIIGKMKLIQDDPNINLEKIDPKVSFATGQQELQKLINGEETTIDKKSLSNISAGQKKIVDSFITMNSFESAATSKGPEMASYIETYGKAITKDPQVLVEKLIKAKAKRSDISGDPEFITAQAQGIFEALMFLDREGKANKLFASTNQIKKGRGFLEVLEEKSQKNIKSFTRFGKLTNGIAENGIGNVNFGKKEDTEVDFSGTNFRTAVPQMDNEQIIEVLMAKGLYPYKSGLDNNVLKALDATASISNYGYLNFPANKEDVVQGLMDGGLFRVNSFPKQDDEGKTIFERQATIALLENKNTYQQLAEISKQIKGDGQEPNKKAESDPNSKSQTNVAKSSNGPLPSDDPNSIANRTRRGEINPQQGGVQLVNQIDDRNQADEIAALEQGDNEGRIRIMQKYQRMRDARATGMSVGGVVNYLATGGNVPSYRANPDPSFFKPKGTDTVPAMLSPGEFVINASATAKHGDLLSAINSGQDVGYSATGGLIEYLAYGDSATSFKKRLKNAGITQKGMMEAIQSGDKQQIYEMNLKAGDAQRNSRNEALSKNLEKQLGFNFFKGPDANKKAGVSRVGDAGNYAEGPQELGSYAIETKPIQLAKEQEQKQQEQQQQKQTRTMPLRPPTQPTTTTTPPDVKDKKPDTADATPPTQSPGEIEQIKNKIERLYEEADQFSLELNNLSKGGIPSSSSDTIPAMLTPGEFVVNARQSSKNASLLHAINTGKDVEGFANGGPVGYYAGGKTRPSDRFNSAATKFGDEVSRLNAAISRISVPTSSSNNTAQYIDIAKSSFEELSRILKTEIKIGSGPIDKFNNAVTQFGTNSTGFNSGFSSSLEKFKTYVDELSAAINRIPGTLNLEIMGTLNASLNVNFDTNSVYAAVTDATESLKGWITSEIDRQITDEMG